MLLLVAFLALLAFLGGFGGKSAKNVECAKGGWKIYQCHDRLLDLIIYFCIQRYKTTYL